MLFAIVALDKAGAAPLRAATRAKHLEYVAQTGNAKLGGPFLDPQGNMIGSLLVIEAEDFEAAKVWAANDPYAKAGLFISLEMRPWKATVNACDAKL